MTLLERVHGSAGIKIIVGSAFLWSWLDALFMSVFFVRQNTHGLMPELATIAVFACSLPLILFALASKAPVKRLLTNISTHAPTRGATWQKANQICRIDFNPRSYARSDAETSGLTADLIDFNPRSYAKSDTKRSP